MDNQEARARVDVIEADREAAAHVYASFRDHDFAGWIRKGENAGGDANFIIQLFARHRLAFTKHPEPRPSPSREEIARVIANAAGTLLLDYYPRWALDAADAILALQPAGWRSMDSAPRDRDILVLREGRQYVARWREGYNTWGVSADRIPSEPGPFAEIGEIGFGQHIAARGPTHWMPLPAPPTGGEG